MKQFEILGPVKVECYKGAAGRVVVDESLEHFCTHHPSIAARRGCYVFGIRASRGYTPIYVGKATKSFEQECFTGHKLKHYNRALADYARGTPVLFFVAEPETRGRANAKAIGEIERYLIALGEAANPWLSNIQIVRKQREAEIELAESLTKVKVVRELRLTGQVHHLTLPWAQFARNVIRSCCRSRSGRQRHR
jgi:hypothetical protein